MFDSSIAGLFGGWPFLDYEFVPRRLLAAVACSRLATGEAVGLPALRVRSPTDCLSPHLGELVRNTNASRLTEESDQLSPSQTGAVERAKTVIKSRIPPWADLIDIPLRFRIVDRPGVISCSCFSHPQTVFLAEAAFDSEMQLMEQMVHELCHVWAYLIEETLPFQQTPSDVLFTLPSGTAGKNAVEVLGAGYVGATLHRWYSTATTGPAVWRRLAELRQYVAGCVAVVDGVRVYSPSGQELLRRLASFARGAAARQAAHADAWRE